MTADQVRAHMIAEHQRRIARLAIEMELRVAAGIGVNDELATIEAMLVGAMLAGIGAQRRTMS